ncbi:prominin-like protein isoform X2 [Drosophila hydei]|uniref:Prominin-like protein isoform X2 n=1 Tax=Drosophila hydei TaxID=7224 RepID=A0A6J1LVI7_DROHY|nr:prominin-like protein isoform X2 [Drosophila hydei]
MDESLYNETSTGNANDTNQVSEFTIDEFVSVTYTEYKSHLNYSLEPTYSKLGMDFIHKFTRTLFESYYAPDEDAPEGYVIAIDNTTAFAVGPKVWANVWQALIARKTVVLVWVLFLLTVIIVVPFIAVCYFCFCCFRCRSICPPCQSRSTATKRILLSLLLIPLILGILFGLVVAFLNDRLINNALRDSSETIMRNSKDNCALLEDICNNVRHLLVNNFGELETVVTSQLFAIADMALKDLTTEAGLFLIEVLEDIFDNMPQALELMKQVKEMQAYLVFVGSQYRDSLRGAKRDLLYVLTVWCDFLPCNQLPNTSAFIEDIENIIYKDYFKLPKTWMRRLLEEKEKFKHALDPMIPPMLRRISIMADTLKAESYEICNVTYGAISDIYLNKMHSTKSFEEFYDNYGRSRWYASVTLLLIMLLIVLILTYALIAGLCLRKDNSGSSCMLIAIVLMFAVLSMIMIMGLFYFTLGLVIYPACILHDDKGRNTLYSLLENVLEKSDAVKNRTLHRANAFANPILTCRGDQSIFDMLRESNLYDMEKLREIKLNLEESSFIQFGKLDVHFEMVTFMPPEEFNRMFKIRENFLSHYHSSLYMDVLCPEVTELDVPDFISELRNWAAEFFSQDHGKYVEDRLEVAYANVLRMATDLNEYFPMQKSIEQTRSQIQINVETIDNLITYENNNFNNSILTLITKLANAQEFIEVVGTDYLRNIVDNYTNYIDNEISHYFDMVINVSFDRIGPCEHLARMHEQNVNKICDHLVNSVNGYWLGLVIFGTLLIPLLCVAHRLMCLYQFYGTAAASKHQSNCPTCMGLPHRTPPSVISISPGPQTSSMNTNANEAFGSNKHKHD